MKSSFSYRRLPLLAVGHDSFANPAPPANHSAGRGRHLFGAVLAAVMGVVFTTVPGGVGKLRAQDVAVDWFTIDAGGGSCSGGTFALMGTVGQPDAAGPVGGGTYAISGGFWGIAAIQTAGAPTLFLTRRDPAHVTLHWTPDTPGWVLQECTDLRAGEWTDVPGGTGGPGSLPAEVTVPADQPRKFFRLKKQ